MKPEKIISNIALSLIFIIAMTLSASAQAAADNTQKDMPEKDAVTSKKTVPAEKDKNKAPLKDTQKKEIPSPDKNKNNTPGKDTQKKDEPSKKSEVPAINNKSAGTDNKKNEVMDDEKKAEKISKTLDYGTQKDRKTAIIMIENIKDEQIKNKLIQKLVFIIEHDSDIDVRKSAVTAIGDYKSETSTPALIKALDDTSEDIQIAACYALSRIKAESAKPKLVELFRKQDLKIDSNLTEAIITALYDIKAPDILDVAVTAGKDSTISKMVREKLIMYIGYTGSAAQKDFLLEIYKNEEEDTGLRSLAIKSVSTLKLKETTPEIKAMLKEIDSYSFNKRKKYYDLYMYSVAALVAMGDTDSIELLMNSLRSDNSSVRLKAVNLIKEFNDERTIDILKYKMENDQSGKVRKAARKALEDKGIIEKGKGDEDLKNVNEKEDKDE